MRHKIGTAAAAALLAMAMAAPACAQGPEITVQRPAAKGDTLQVTLSIQEPSQSAHALLCSLGYDKTQLQLDRRFCRDCRIAVDIRTAQTVSGDGACIFNGRCRCCSQCCG